MVGQARSRDMQLLEVGNTFEVERDVCCRRTIVRCNDGLYAINDKDLMRYGWEKLEKLSPVPQNSIAWLNCRVKEICDYWK